MELRARPGWILRGACLFGLLTWASILFLLTSYPHIGAGTWASAFFMAGFFAVLLAAQNTSTIELTPEGLRSRTALRSLRCAWPGVGKVRRIPAFPGFTLFAVPTQAGTVVFSSLWRNHAPLLEALEARAG